VAFNFALLKEIRQRDSIKRVHLAKLLGVSSPYLYMIERGIKQPSIALTKKLAGIIGVPAEDLLQASPETLKKEKPYDVSDSAFTLIEFKKKLDCERGKSFQAEKRVMELERKNEHLILLLDLHMKFGDIVCPKSFSKSEMEKLAELVKKTGQEGELTFNEMLVTLRLKRSVLTNILNSVKRVYKCRFVEGEGIAASNPGEAAMQLRCFDCADLESGLCRGYGDEQHPDDIVLLILKLEAKGIYNRKEQSRILEEGYNARYSAHAISEIMHRHRNGLHIPDGMLNMAASKRRNRNGRGKADN
jgi:transcriptional regulator with XRE-family HTH domain